MSQLVYHVAQKCVNYRDTGISKNNNKTIAKNGNYASYKDLWLIKEKEKMHLYFLKYFTIKENKRNILNTGKPNQKKELIFKLIIRLSISTVHYIFITFVSVHNVFIKRRKL